MKNELEMFSIKSEQAEKKNQQAETGKIKMNKSEQQKEGRKLNRI